jgi:hypothetical protein
MFTENPPRDRPIRRRKRIMERLTSARRLHLSIHAPVANLHFFLPKTCRPPITDAFAQK